jgi:hypothetical protein
LNCTRSGCCGPDVTGTFETKGELTTLTTIVDPLKTKQPLIYSLVKVGDVVTVNTKGLFEDDHQLMDVMKVAHDDVHGLEVDVTFTIEGSIRLNWLTKPTKNCLINCLSRKCSYLKN